MFFAVDRDVIAYTANMMKMVAIYVSMEGVSVRNTLMILSLLSGIL